jgi:hypothetical protein
MYFRKIGKATYDILRGTNATVWGGLESAEKVGKIAKTGLSGADAIIGLDLALKDCARGDYFSTTLDRIGSLSTVTGLVLGNILATKAYTFWTGLVTVCCRTLRGYCQKYRTFWGCTAAGGEGVRKFVKFKVEGK